MRSKYSREAIFHIWPPMVFFSLTDYTICHCLLLLNLDKIQVYSLPNRFYIFTWLTKFPFFISTRSFVMRMACQLRMHMYARTCSSYECFILRNMRLPCKLLGQGYITERSGNAMGDIGISLKIMKSPCPKCYMTFLDVFTKSWPCYYMYRTAEPDLITDFDFITKFREDSIEHLQRVQLANRGRLLLRTPGPVPFETCICSYVETIHCWTCHDSGLWISNIPWSWRYFHFVSTCWEKKEDIWFSPFTKAPTARDKSKKERKQHKNVTQNFDCTTIADRLRTVSWSNNSQPTGVVKEVYGYSTFLLTTKAV